MMAPGLPRDSGEFTPGIPSIPLCLCLGTCTIPRGEGGAVLLENSKALGPIGRLSLDSTLSIDGSIYSLSLSPLAYWKCNLDKYC